ncbi:MAG: hypothetical protein IJR70_02535 [Eubacterium sp.]|nr:hypothetical protein [Eubacterium sp.]
MKAVKRVMSLMLSVVIVVTTLSAMPVMAASSDKDLIMNFDLGAGSGTNTDYSCKDYYSNANAKTSSWSNIAEVRTVGEKTALYNQNGYVFANVGETALYNNDSWRIEFMFQKKGSEQNDALLIGLGTANGSYGIADANTDNILTIHQGGYIYVCSQEINDASANEKLKLNIDELSYYSIIFSAQNKYLTLTKNGQIAFEMHLNDEQSERFKHVGFISAGCHVGDGSIGRGWYTGTIEGYYYYIKAYNEPECPETVGKLTVDPVIYTHGEKSSTQNNSTGDYGYMMYGTQIADSTVRGEEKTAITLPKGATIESVYCPDNNYVDVERSKGEYYLCGNFSADEYKVSNNEEKYARIRFKYTLNDKQYVEWHNFSVKTNPVATHSMIYAQSYKSGTFSNSEQSAVAFQVTALGSVGPDSSGATSANWGSTSLKSHNANSWNIFDPFSDELQCNTNNNGSVNPVFIEQNANSVVDKTTGFGVAASNTNGEVNVGIYTDYAKYYVDKSADSILGAEHKAGENTYRIKLFLENLSQSYTSGQRVDVTEHGSYWMEEIDINHLGEYAWNDKRKSETVTLQGNTDNGSTTTEYWHAAENQEGRKAKATIITKISVTVFDKTNARNTLNNSSLSKYDSSYYDAAKWHEYSNARLEAEGYINNYEKTEVENVYLENLQNKYNALGSVADYSALIAAIRQAENAVNTPEIYTDTNSLKEKLTAVKTAAFSDGTVEGTHLLDNQNVVDSKTMELQFEYSETVTKKSNVEVQFSVYLDGELKGTNNISAEYNKTLLLNSADIFANSQNYSIVKWTNGGTTVSTKGYQYNLVPTQKCRISCYLVSKPEQEDNFCKVELFDITKRKNTEFYVNKTSTYAEVISQAQRLTSDVLYYAIDGWKINDTTDFVLTDVIASDSLKVYPLYKPTVENYRVNVSGGFVSTGGAGYAFDAKAAVSFEGDGNFICWAVKYDNDTYRVASYSPTYDFYISGNTELLAITEENYESYSSKLQKNSTSDNTEEVTPSLEELKMKKAIPSLRGSAEDESCAEFKGAYWDAENSKLMIIAQVADKAEYASCGTVALYNGRTVVTPSVSQTESNQFMISYRLGESFKNRKISIMAFAKKSAENDEMIYSPKEEITIPAKDSVVSIGNSISSKVKYDLKSGTYDIIKNNTNVLTNVTADFSMKNGSYLDVTWYENHTPKVTKITDSIGNGTQLTVTSTAWGWPNVEQIFRVYDNKDYVLTRVNICYDDKRTVESNYMCPVFVSKAGNFKDGKQPWSQFLHVPYDNDGWSIFKNYSIKKNNYDTSHEFSAIYDSGNNSGLVIGSVTHDNWKTGVYFEGSSNGVKQIKAFGGAASKEDAYRPGYGSNTYRGPETHGYVKGSNVESPLMFIGDYSDWKYGIHQFASANTAIVPMRTAGDLGGVPFGWQSWGSIADYLTYENVMGNIKAMKDNFQSVWETDENGNPDGTPIVMNLDSWANEIKLDNGNDDPWDDNDNALRAFVAQCKANGQIPGIYHTPFTNWCSYEQLTTEGEEWWTHPDRVLKKDGEFVNPIDGGYPLDPTNPDVIQDNINRINYFKSLGFKYVKLDFLSHGLCEGDYYNSNITTGMQAFNYGMQAIIDAAGDDMFINYSIAPLFPYQYANGRRMGCDCWYSSSDVEYILNQITYGFWEGDVYQYPDPDHTVLYARRNGNGNDYSSENEAKMMVTANAIAGANMLLGDSFFNYDYYKDGNKVYSYTDAQNAIQRANKYALNRQIIALAKKGKTFEPVMDDIYPYHAKVFRMEDDNGDIYYAIFRFNGDSEWYFRVNLPTEYNYVGTELWSGTQLRNGDSIWAWVDIEVPNNDAVIYKFSRV